MPKGVFELIVKRLAQGDSIRQIAKYCNAVKPENSIETYRKWLVPLDKTVSAQVAERKAALNAKKAIDDYYREKEKMRKALEAQQVEKEPSAREVKQLKANITRAIMDIDSAELIRDAWLMQRRRVQRITAIEEKLGYVLPNSHKEMDSLTKIIELVLKHELGIALLTREGAGVPASLEIDKLSPLGQEIAQLDEVDRNIIQELGHKFANMIERQTNAAKVKRLGTNGSGANGTVSGNSDGNSGTPIPGST
jgi:hypothetical protein